MSLYDYTGAAIQQQAVVARLQEMARGVPSDRSVALYTDGCLARQQAKRVAAECPNMRVFDNRADALAGLSQQRNLSMEAYSNHHSSLLSSDS